jgi:hypothetical protein
MTRVYLSLAKDALLPATPPSPDIVHRSKFIKPKASVYPQRYPRISQFCSRAEELKAFRAAPPIDGVEAPVG